MHSISEKQTDRQEQCSRRNCNLLHGIPESKGEVTDDVAVKTICENINDNIITVDDIDPEEKSKTCDREIRSINVRDRGFSNKRN